MIPYLYAHMLKIYLSYAPEEAAHAARCLQWLKPLEEKYFLQIWYNRPVPPEPPLPPPWNVLLFWYTPAPVPTTPYHPALPEKSADSHIYLFLTSPKWLNTPWVSGIELPNATAQYERLGADFVRMYALPVLPCDWQKERSLRHVALLGSGKPLADLQSADEAKAIALRELEKVIETLRRNWLEEKYRLGESTAALFRPAPTSAPPPRPVPLPAWLGWLVVSWLLYSVLNWYGISCTAEPSVRPYFPHWERAEPGLRRTIPPQLPVPDTLPFPSAE
jgi:hypothetical protein